MGIQSFRPSSGGGVPGMGYIASIFMETYARNWSQAGTAGYYMMSSQNNSTGYMYFVGTGTTTGGPLGQTLYVSHSFTSIQIVASKNDLVSLYKAATKTTTDLANPGTKFADWLYNSKYTSYTVKSQTSGSWTLPSVGLPLIDAVVVGGGGGGSHHAAGGGGGGVVSLSYYPINSTGVHNYTVGDAGYNNGSGGNTVFNTNIIALGGGGAAGNNQNGYSGGSGGGAGRQSTSGTYYGGSATQTSPSLSAPTTAVGYGNRGGNISGGSSSNHHGAGGGGAGGAGADTSSPNPTPGGPGHFSQIDYLYYGAGGSGSNHDTQKDAFNGGVGTALGHGNPGQGGSAGWNNHTYGQKGIVIVRYYA
jgi:hypothetical protein